MMRIYAERFISFNTQPREGGCSLLVAQKIVQALFQHTAARRRLRECFCALGCAMVFQHTAARRRLPVAGFLGFSEAEMFQHTAARRRLHDRQRRRDTWRGFQHTAARRRLLTRQSRCIANSDVSTHSRAKAAA